MRAVLFLEQNKNIILAAFDWKMLISARAAGVVVLFEPGRKK
jgi:hypothetical protein